MSRKTLVMGTALAVVLLAVGGLFASNMGFKLNYQVLAASDPNSFDGTNTLGLPFNRMSGLNTASQLVDDIGSANVQSVSMYVESTGGLVSYSSSGAGTNFSLSTAEGYFVRMLANASYIVVGSHDPTFSIDLDSAAEADSFDGTNFIAYPYHATGNTASQLVDDIGSANVQSVSMYVESTGGLVSYSSSGAGTNFSLTPGEAYFVRMLTTTPYAPSHY